MSFDFFKKTSESARAGFEKQSPAGTSFAGFRKFAKSINESLMNERKQIEEKKEENRRTYSVKVAGEKNLELDSSYKALANGKKEVCLRVLDKLIESKKSAITQYTLTPPTDKQLRLIDSLSRRIGSVGDTEWNMVVAEISTNYQASAILNDLAKKNGKDYSIPFTPDEQLEHLETLKTDLKEVINCIEQDPLDAGLKIATFFNYTPDRGIYGLTNLYAEELDSIAPAYVAESIADLTDPADLSARLLEARNTAYRNKANDLFTQIVRTTMSIRDDGLNDDNLHRAEELIAMVRTLYPEKPKEESGADQ